jgi:hypothetical protein
MQSSCHIRTAVLEQSEPTTHLSLLRLRNWALSTTASTACVCLASHPGCKIKILDLLRSIGGTRSKNTILLHLFEFLLHFWVH